MKEPQDYLTYLKKISQKKTYLRHLDTETKNKVLLRLAQKLLSHSSSLLDFNKKDLLDYQQSPNFQKAFEDRLTLTPQRLEAMAQGLRVVATLPEVNGQVVEQKTLPNKLKLRRVRAPLGVIFFIFESRPNVITEAFSLAFKSGNILILKGGKESRSTSGALYRLIQESLQEEGVSPDVLWGLEEASREVTDFLMQQNQWIDVLIPRGGEALIEHVTKNSRIPLIKNDRGLCHLYVHEQAQLEMAQQILLNAKTQRPGVCNAVETLLIDHKIAADFLPIMHLDLRNKGVEFYVCEKTEKIMKGWEGVHPITAHSFQTEYLDLKLNVKRVESLEEAITHIENYGSRHSEAIITENEIVAQEFIGRVDAAVVYWNASTRFTDGGEFGMGGEMGISTQKLHVRGPVGMEALTSLRWIVEGSGQTR